MLSLPLKDHRTWNRKGFPLGSHILGAECNPIFHNNLLALKKKKKVNGKKWESQECIIQEWF